MTSSAALTSSAARTGPAGSGITRVLVLADAPVLRRGLHGLLGELPGLQAVGVAGEPRRAATLVEAARPHAVVVELGRGWAATLAACRELRERHPQLAVVALATDADPAAVDEALAAGVRGYLLLGASPALLGWAVLAARAGRTVVDPQIRRPPAGSGARPAGARPIASVAVPLSPRESDVLAELLQGRSNRAIGEVLFIAEDTVKSHVKSILRKYGARDRAHLISVVLSARADRVCGCGAALPVAA